LRGPRGGNLDTRTKEYRRRSHDGQVLPDGQIELHGWRDVACFGQEKEQPWHRMAAYMMLEGKTNKRIAEVVQCHEQTISILRSQRWFRELLARMAAKEHAPILSRLREEAAASLDTLIELRDGSESDRVRLAAATTIFEHA